MKFTKKILVAIVAIAMLACCFAFSASAEAPTLPVEKLTDLYEYLRYETYLVEDYDNQQGEEYAFVSSHYYAEGVPFFNFIKNEGTGAAVVTDATNKYLSITTNAGVKKSVGYKMYFEGSDFATKDFVASFDFMSGTQGGTNGANVSLVVTLADYVEDITLFAANMSNDAEPNQFLYATYDKERITYSTAAAEATPALGVWYHVDVVYSFETQTYSIIVKSGDDVVFTSTTEVDKSLLGIDSVRLYVDNANGADATVTAFDEVLLYEGTAVRDVKNADKALADLVIAVNDYAVHSETPLENKIEVADFYVDFFGGEEGICAKAPQVLELYPQVKQIADGALSFINSTYATALITYVSNTAALDGYYEKIEYRDEYAKFYFDLFSDEEKFAELTAGMDAALVEDIEEALESYVEITEEIKIKAQYSIAFVKNVEENYDSKNTDYQVMKVKYASLSALIDGVEPSFRYSDINKKTKYPTAQDAIAEYYELENKINKINYNASQVFMPAVEKFAIVNAESVSATAPFYTTNFEELYQNYLTAKSVYVDGSVDYSLDATTYPGLADAVAKYLEYEEYILDRIAESSAFVAAIKGAESSVYYATIVAQLAEAAYYLDNNIEKSLEKYSGVEEAIALYQPLCEKLETSVSDINNYIAAVNQINIDADYATLKAAVTNATTLKAKFNILGYDGLEEANVKYALAESKVAALEGHSSTLVATVKALKSATTLAERRNLIYIAMNAKDNCENSLAGVSEAKAELESQITKYNEDVARVNALFAGVVEKACSAVSSVAPTDAVSLSANVVAVLNKKD